MKYAIYGAGSLGTAPGAYLAKNSVVNALNGHGAVIGGTVNMTVPVASCISLRPYNV